jgi:hypothetical protein
MAASGPCLKETGPKGGVLLALLRAENVQDGEARPLQVMTKSDNTFGTEESGDGEEDAGGTSVDNILDLKIKAPPPRAQKRAASEKRIRPPDEGRIHAAR